MPALSKVTAPAARRHVMAVHRAIHSAVREGDMVRAQRLLRCAPATYRATVALLSYLSRAAPGFPDRRARTSS